MGSVFAVVGQVSRCGGWEENRNWKRGDERKKQMVKKRNWKVANEANKPKG
jgi:hypothetical protein